MAENVENKEIEQKIDKNKDHMTDYVEIRDFILEEKNQSENIKELGEYLNKLPDREYNEIKQTLQYIMEDPEIVKIFEGAGEKVKKNKDLADDEKSIIYLSAVLFGKGDGFKNIGKFDLKLPIEKICDGQLLAYIQKRYNNYSYDPNKGKEDSRPTVENAKKKVKEGGYRNPNIPNPIPEEIDEEEKVENEYKGLPQIPLIRGKEYAHEYCNKIIKWAEDNGYLMEAERESKERNEFRSHIEYDETGEGKVVHDKDYEAYVKYDKLLYAFGKYCEVINKKHEELVKKAGYWDLDEFAEEMKYIDGMQEYLKTKYPDLDEAMERVNPYLKEMEENRNKYFRGKTEEEVEKAGKEFEEYKKYEQEKIEEYGITEETIKSLCEIPKDEKELEKYLKNLNAYIGYQNETEGKKREYGEDIDTYLGYVKGIQAIRGKYGETGLDLDLEMIKGYMDDLNSAGKMYKPKGQEVGRVPGALTIFDKFNKYSELISADPELSKDLKNMKTINEVLSDPTSEDFWIEEVKKEKTEEKKRQEKRDRRWNNWYENYPVWYELLSTGASIWNTFINFTVGTGTSLGAMICGLILGKDHYQSALERKERWDSSLTIGVTKEQQEGIYDSETGEITLNWKNGPYMVASSVTNMYLLILGGDGAGKGVSKIFSNIGRDAVGKAGLFSMSFITQAGQSYTEAMNAGLEGNGAFIYSMLTATAQSSLELVSPNEVLLGKGTGVGKEMVRALCKDGNKGGIKLAGKYFLKTMFREMGEEILQEEMQLAAGNLINDFYNGIWNTDFESDWGYKNFLATAMITAMTTGIATGISSGGTTMQIMRGKNNKLIEKIFTTDGLYEDVMKVLDNAIKGEQKIPDVKPEQLEVLKTMLLADNQTEQETENQTVGKENQENDRVKQGNEERNNETGKIRNIKEIISILTGRKIQTINEYDIEDWSEFNIEDLNKLVNIKNYYGFNLEPYNVEPYLKNVDTLGKIKLQLEAFGILEIGDRHRSSFINENIERFEQFLEGLEKCGFKIEFNLDNIINLFNYAGNNKNILKLIYENKGLNFILQCQDVLKLMEIFQIIQNDNMYNKCKLIGDSNITINNINELKELGNFSLEQIKELITIKNECKTNNIIILESDVESLLLIDKIGINVINDYIEIQKKTGGLITLELSDPKSKENIEKCQKNIDNLIGLIPFFKSKGITNIGQWNDLLIDKLINDTTILNIDHLKVIFEIEGNFKSIEGYNVNDFLGYLIWGTDEDIRRINEVYNKIKQFDIEFKINEINQLLFINVDNIKSDILQYFKFTIMELTDFTNKNIKLSEHNLATIKKLKSMGVNIKLSDIEKIFLITEGDTEIIEELINANVEVNIKDIEFLKQINDGDLNIVKNKYKNYYEGYNYVDNEICLHRNIKRGRIIENILEYVGNIINKNRDINTSEIIEIVRTDLVTLTPGERYDIIKGINMVVEKFNIVRKYLDFQNGPYNTPKELLCAITGITDPMIIEKIPNDINIIQYGGGMCFIINDEETYKLIGGDEVSGGFSTKSSKIPELTGTFFVVGPDSDNPKGTIIHEGQHNRNGYFMVDKEIESPITRAKDEIIAYIRDGRKTILKATDGFDYSIENTLTGENSIYKYSLKGQARENHKKLVKELLVYANDIIKLTEDPTNGLTRGTAISILSDTPVEGWKDLHTRIMDAVKHKKTGETFRRAGTAEKETVINNLKNCNSIEEIKYILNDPQYSHLGRGTDNKGGIEISAIIDEVINRGLSISFIPQELSDIVKRFIK